MPVTVGSRLGPYLVLGQLGSGGMGVVYRARDTRLQRDVAIKVLSESVTSDPERLARFTREAQVLASLNHPHIAHVYGLEGTGGTQAIVMELVDGEDLSHRLSRGPLPVAEALAIAKQVAQALEAAHDQGVVHRDLKPANIRIRPDGSVKVLDFGLATTLAPAPSSADADPSTLTTVTSPTISESRVIRGTAAYMSPEQAKGRLADRRSDVWAFGAVLFEMLSGLRPFAAEDVSETLAAVLMKEPDWSALPPMTPPTVVAVLRQCLQKDRKLRPRDIGDVSLALDGAFAPALPMGAAASTVASPDGWRRLGWPMVGAALVAASIVGLATWTRWPTAESRPVTRFAYALQEGHSLTGLGAGSIALAPDGRAFAYKTVRGIYVRSLSDLEPRLVPGTPDQPTAFFFSPDGAWLAYSDDNELKRLPIQGGGPTVLATLQRDATVSGSWAEDGSILFNDREGIHEVAAAGGAPRLVVARHGDEQFYGPQRLQGDLILFSVTATGDWNDGQAVVQSMSTGERTVIANDVRDARYVRSGQLLYARGDGLFARAFDVRNATTAGPEIALVRGIYQSASNRVANYAVTDSTLVYVRPGAQLRTLVWVDRNGRETPIDVPARPYAYAQLSPDGTRIVLDIRDQQNDIWIWDLLRQNLQRLTFDPGLDRGPIWTPDGKRIAFSRTEEDSEAIVWLPADGSGKEQLLTKGFDRGSTPSDFTPDGSAILYVPRDGPYDIGLARVADAPSGGAPLLAGPAGELGAAVSPDGHWLAYQSDETGRYEIYVRPFPAVDSARWQISNAGGDRPVWGRDGRELFYRESDGDGIKLMAVAVTTRPSFSTSSPQMLFRGEYLAPNDGRQVYDVDRRGERFLMIKAADVPGQLRGDSIVVVQDWQQELGRLAAAGN
ncbi:MAG: protein kinase [Vicinamibacterales bacterium]